MSAFTRLAALVIFAGAALAQPLTLDACSVSCEAARAARMPSVAPPCHHTTSCASQISQPTSPSSSAVVYALAPATVTVHVPVMPVTTFVHSFHLAVTSSSPPRSSPLRV